MLSIRNKVKWLCLLLLIPLLFVCSCLTVEDGFVLIGQKRGLTENQASVGAAYMLLQDFAEKNGDGDFKICQEDGSVVIDYTVITGKEKISFLSQKFEDYEYCLNDEGWNDYFLFHEAHGSNLRASFEKRAVLCEWWKQNFLKVEQELKLKYYLSGSYSWGFDKKNRLSPYIIYPLAKKEFIFKPDYVRIPKDQKILATLEAHHVFQVEVDNPDYPHLEPIIDKIWEKRCYRIRILSFDLPPFDQKADYIEIYRLDPNGEQEKCPIISVFHKNNEHELTLAVIDMDKEGELGFGVPDLFEGVNIKTGSDFYNDYQALLNKALEGKKKKRKAFARNNQQIWLVPSGDVPSIVEKSQDGWPLPTGYKNEENGTCNNFKVAIKYKAKNGNGEALGPPPYEIEYIAFYYYGDYEWQDGKGRVIEYYKPHFEISYKKVKSISTTNSGAKLLTIVWADETVSLKTPKSIIGKMYRIDFDHDGKRSMLVDEDGDGKFESRQTSRKPESIEIVDHTK